MSGPRADEERDERRYTGQSDHLDGEDVDWERLMPPCGRTLAMTRPDGRRACWGVLRQGKCTECGRPPKGAGR